MTPTVLALPSVLLTVDQVARCLGVSARSVWRYVALGRLPEPVRFTRRHVRWRSEEIAEAIRQHQGRLPA
jgi:excisionase family DNA binding protein